MATKPLIWRNLTLVQQIVIFILLFLVISAVLLFSFYIYLQYPAFVKTSAGRQGGKEMKLSNPKFLSAQIGSKTYQLEVADTSLKQVKGLSGRNRLEENTGMIFIFEKADYQRFWMFGMKFPLDFVWVNDNKVVDLTENVLPPCLPRQNLIDDFQKDIVDLTDSAQENLAPLNQGTTVDKTNESESRDSVRGSGSILQNCLRSISSFTSKAPADKVIELSVGEIKKSQIKDGAIIEFSE